MPREQRKRGKRQKKVAEPEPEQPHHEPEPTSGPSWIVAGEAGPSQENADYPFGVLDPDVKAYFRTVDDKLKGWQVGYGEEDAGLVEGEDPNETRRMFLNAALSELNGKELQLATDPDCSVILERMMHSMDDFSRRVFLDRLAGSFTQLACHRFASHVCQTLVTLSADTISRESRGIMPKAPAGEDVGVLRTMTEMIKAAYDEIMPTLSDVVMDHFGSHVLGALLILLCGDKLPLSTSSTQGMVRSKKSAKYRAKQGPMTAIIDGVGVSTSGKTVPADFPSMAIKLVRALREQMDANSIRSLASHKAANPLMQIMIQVEARGNGADEPGSVMDSFLTGLIGEMHAEVEDIQASDYVDTMLRDATASHILETILSVAPDRVASQLWETYFKGKLAKLCVHPVTNFVVASAVSRLSSDQLGDLFEEMNGKWAGVLKHSRTGALRAAVIRAAEVGQGEPAIEAVNTTFGFDDDTDKKHILLCVLTCMPLSSFLEQNPAVLLKPVAPDGTDEAGATGARRHQPDRDFISMQGSLILQATMRLPQPFNQIIIESIEALTIDERLALAHHVTSARVIDAMLESPTVPVRAKRIFITAFIGHYHQLVDDKIGSRIGDQCWAKADTFLKEKIAKSLIMHETFLAASHYGRFFARKLRLTLLQRNPEEWKAVQSTSEAPKPVPVSAVNGLSRTAGVPAHRTESIVPEPVLKKKRKARSAETDEIDVLFSSAGKKQKHAPVAKPALHEDKGSEEVGKLTKAMLDDKGDKGLASVLGAIKETRTHEKAEVRPKKKRKT